MRLLSCSPSTTRAATSTRTIASRKRCTAAGWGDIILGEARFKLFRSAEYFASGTGWRGTWALDGGGSLANQGAHLVDMLLWYMGDAVRVYAETAVMKHDIETEDLGARHPQLRQRRQRHYRRHHNVSRRGLLELRSSRY